MPSGVEVNRLQGGSIDSKGGSFCVCIFIRNFEVNPRSFIRLGHRSKSQNPQLWLDLAESWHTDKTFPADFKSVTKIRFVNLLPWKLLISTKLVASDVSARKFCFNIYIIFQYIRLMPNT